MLNNLLITRSSSPEEITEYIQNLREQKGKEKKALKLINEALSFGHDFVINIPILIPRSLDRGGRSPNEWN